MEEQTYRILTLATTGWELIDEDRAVNLTKQQCDEMLQHFVQVEGYNPNELRAVKNV